MYDLAQLIYSTTHKKMPTVSQHSSSTQIYVFMQHQNAFVDLQCQSLGDDVYDSPSKYVGISSTSNI